VQDFGFRITTIIIVGLVIIEGRVMDVNGFINGSVKNGEKR
jgi:uncharacterized membrane protein YecN with MAPEG domain